VPIKIVFLDCDGTLTRVKSSWEYLHRRLNLWEGLAEEYERLYLDGKIDYYEFCKRDAQLWAGIPVKEIMRIIEEIHLMPGAKEMVRAFKEMGLVTAIISTGLSLLVNRVKDLLGIDYAESNELLSFDGALTGEIRIKVEQNKKDKVVKKMLNELALRKEEALAVGDGIGDLSMFESVGVSIGFNPDKTVLKSVKYPIFGETLEDVIPIVKRYV